MPGKFITHNDILNLPEPKITSIDLVFTIEVLDESHHLKRTIIEHEPAPDTPMIEMTIIDANFGTPVYDLIKQWQDIADKDCKKPLIIDHEPDIARIDHKKE